MGVEDDGVAGGEHADGVAGQGGQAVGDGRDRAYDAEGRVVGEGDAVIAGVAFGAQVLDAGDGGNGVTQLGDLVVEAADLGFLKFSAAEFLGVFDADLADAGDGPGAVFEGAGTEDAEGGLGRAHGVVDRGVDAGGAGRAVVGRLAVAVGVMRPRACPSG